MAEPLYAPAWQVVLSCEHASRDVPADLAPLFRGASEVLRSHRGWDLGALEVATHLASVLGTPLHRGHFSRLVVDLNRSPQNPRVFSNHTAQLPRSTRSELLARYHQPHREAVRREVAERVRWGPVLHLGLHSFTPVLDGRVRDVDLGLLYDPKRPLERRMSTALIDAVGPRLPTWRVRRNAPYRGTSDGLTRWLRELFPAERYAGIEVEISQRWLTPSRRPRTERLLAEACIACLQLDSR